MKQMKCLIIYYSQTGNTEKIARAIQKGVQQAAGHCDIAKIKDVNPRRLFQYDLLGLGCPVIGFQEPMNVMAFIKNMKFVGGKHIFVFDTHATRGEFFFPSIVPKLRRKGMVVVGMFDSYAAMGNQELCPTGGHPDAKDLEDAEKFGRDVVETSRRIAAGETDLIPDYPPYVEYFPLKYIRWRQAKEKEMGVPPAAAERRIMVEYHPEKCKYPNCWLCMENCPMETLDITVRPPVIGKNCMRCMTCVKVCPNGAMTMARPEGMGQGSRISPEVAKKVFEEFYLKPLAKAEAEGRFRRYVPVEKLSFGFGGPPPKEKGDHEKSEQESL